MIMGIFNTIGILVGFGMLFYHGSINKINYAIIDVACLLFFVIKESTQDIIREIKKK